MSQTNVPAIVFGGLFLGAWLFFVFSYGLQTPWATWGLFGIAIAGGMYAGRLVKDTYRVLVWTAVGILLGVTVMFAIFDLQLRGIIAIVLTSTGAGLIASALPPYPPTMTGQVPPYPYAHGHYDPYQAQGYGQHYGQGYGGYAPQEPYPHGGHDPYAQQQGAAQYGYGQPMHDPYAHPQAPPHAQGGRPAEAPPEQGQARGWELEEDEQTDPRKRKRDRHGFDPNYR